MRSVDVCRGALAVLLVSLAGCGGSNIVTYHTGYPLTAAERDRGGREREVELKSTSSSPSDRSHRREKDHGRRG